VAVDMVRLKGNVDRLKVAMAGNVGRTGGEQKEIVEILSGLSEAVLDLEMRVNKLEGRGSLLDRVS